MIQVQDKVVSTELFENMFTCHLKKCHGLCCVYGDAGAPLEKEEAKILEQNFEQIRPFMRPEGIRAVEKKGTWEYDDDGEQVTPLVGREECAYVIYDHGIARCAIEAAFFSESQAFRKPISCHLYPIRVSLIGEMTALNYHRWQICKPAERLGKEYGLPVFRFVKDALIRKYGQAFYDELEFIYKEWKQQQ